ncbi:MAG: biopolymer transporter ExbD [bacterium]|nr:biopolymer transporter ExbD [bacterium]
MKNIKQKYLFYRKRKAEARERNDHEFDSSSVGDLAFLLLIFFIVTSSFILRQGIFFSLPSKSAGARKVEASDLVNLYPEEADFTIEDAFFTRKEVIEKLKKEKDVNKEVTVVIHMYSRLKYERLVDSMSVVKESGVRNVSLKNYE